MNSEPDILDELRLEEQFAANNEYVLKCSFRRARFLIMVERLHSHDANDMEIRLFDFLARSFATVTETLKTNAS